MSRQQLLPECLENILINLSETKDLYSCLMVNKFWCTVVVPYLWRYPFKTAGTSKERCNMVTRTYLSCVSEDSRKKLIDAGINMSEYPRRPLFDYVSYLQGLIIDQRTFDVIPLIFRLKKNNISSHEIHQKLQVMSAHEEWILKSQKHLVEQELAKVLLRGCTRLHSLEIYQCDFLSNLIPKILSFSQYNSSSTASLLFKSPSPPSNPSSQKLFHSLREISCGSLSDNKPTYDFLMMMSNNCKLIHTITVHDINSMRLGKALASVVSAQDCLTCLDLNYSNSYNFSTYEHIFQSLYDDQYNQIQLPSHLQNLFPSSQNSSIKKKISSTSPSLSRLKLSKTNLHNVKKHTLDHMIKKCDKLQSLELDHCTSINSLTPLQHSLTKLNNLKVTCYDQDLEFVTDFFQASNFNLRNIYLSWKTNSPPFNPISLYAPPTISSYNLEESFKRIRLLTNYCTQVRNLYLEVITPQELLLIFRSLIHVQKLSVTFNEQTNWDELMDELGENIPKELQWIEIRNRKELPFSVKGLQTFLERVKEINGGLELYFRSAQQAYLDVTKKYDFKIINYAGELNW
ncbi:5844_t:CDS:1 [Funneliformis mosseae]|uniref:5844_t:CDS:1 n=1 Tax=Funneliformis mosseae TaxID=27381 RepID=A0A9N9AX63_FUNMO|nr:5844_t:CDS:1 [Funneliformis mosseae]